MNPHVISYFKNRNINVQFNVLGSSEALRKAFVNDTCNIVNSSEKKLSHYVKYECYRYFYPDIERRPKLTGFEQFNKQDQHFRVTKSPTGQNVTTPYEFVIDDYSGVFSVMREDGVTIKEYLNVLIDELSGYSDMNLLYLSGGMDSEFVAKTLLNMGKKFIPVIFNWSNNYGEIMNADDTLYALEFCKKENLIPIIETVNIEGLWESSEFVDLVKKTWLFSPQLTTHVHMVDLMSDRFPGYNHLFGGEVRFIADQVTEDGDKCNLVFLAKPVPGSLTLTAPGSYIYRVPPTVTSTRVILIGGGGGGCVHGLIRIWRNAFPRLR